ncbi:hypothetical protein [Chitinophaga sp. XS-30]|uniref:hypothetical protein n=1 Tax=Chitinophaga sp. XS-30 TaxID=2604421 RepID=UPI0011DD135A|nr:hypothetical protein [Chitinophaga sp. XS-30]QEH42691.1 hypothetical protein FW415_18130 [Chitinophaga sp. XS-30]
MITMLSLGRADAYRYAMMPADAAAGKAIPFAGQQYPSTCLNFFQNELFNSDGFIQKLRVRWE